jgi:hypothetical protein
VPTVLKSGSLNLLEPSGPVKACNGITLPLLSLLNELYINSDAATGRKTGTLNFQSSVLTASDLESLFCSLVNGVLSTVSSNTAVLSGVSSNTAVPPYVLISVTAVHCGPKNKLKS